jgi:hypothetical protein
MLDEHHDALASELPNASGLRLRLRVGDAQLAAHLDAGAATDGCDLYRTNVPGVAKRMPSHRKRLGVKLFLKMIRVTGRS